MTCNYLDLGSASDWSYPKGNLLQPIRSTDQIWVVKRHQYGISALFSLTSFRADFGRKFFYTKLLSRLSHKICRLLSRTRASYGSAFNHFLNFESADKYLWVDNSNEASSTVLAHGATCFSAFYNLKFWILASLTVKRLILRLWFVMKVVLNFQTGMKCLSKRSLFTK